MRFKNYIVKIYVFLSNYMNFAGMVKREAAFAVSSGDDE